MYFPSMGFRENLKSELVFQDIRVKELAHKSGINPRTIEQYLSAAAKMPSAENAVKIASALGVSVEYLVTGEKNKNSELSKESEETKSQILLYKKYFELINQAEHLNEQQLKALENLMKTM
jgi:transcriptional regulator with XRE-family HTH domain